ncbi:MAG: triose-phosphate isomerase [Phycisphaerales bacterium]
MNTGLLSAGALARGIAAELSDPLRVDIAVFPPFPFLLSVNSILRERGAGVMLGAQNIYHKPNGAFTGEVSAEMLLDCGVRTVLVGHSERRHILGESDDVVHRKVLRALEAGLDVVLCIGETLEQRQTGQTDSVNERQLRNALEGVSSEQMPRVVIAYEPVWAIGTGHTASPADAQDAHLKIRRVIASMFSPDMAASTRIIYGGSVKSSNAAELFAQADIDGGLIGGASLDAVEFMKIVRAAATGGTRTDRK